MKKTVQILNAKQYDFANDNGERVKGSSFTCIYDEESKTTEKSKGVEVIKFNAPYEFFNQITILPGYYDVDFEIKINADGKGKLLPETVTLIKK